MSDITISSATMPVYCSRKDMAAMIGVCERTIDNMVADGIFRAVKLGDRILHDVQHNLAAVARMPPQVPKGTRHEKKQRGPGRPRKVPAASVAA